MQKGSALMNRVCISPLKEIVSKSIRNLPKETRNGFDLKGYQIRMFSWKTVYRNAWVEKIFSILPEMTIKQALDTTTMDKYLMKAWTKLYDYAKKGEKEKYDKLCRILMKHSKALRLQLMFQVEPKWTTRMSYRRMRYYFRTLDWILKFSEPYFHYKRIQIPKKGTKETRPLAVPDVVSRALARAQYQFLNCWVEGQNLLAPCFYGTKRNKGSSAAWNEIMNKIIWKKKTFLNLIFRNIMKQ